jgi:tetratricopeptide (TPR) repeat protein
VKSNYFQSTCQIVGGLIVAAYVFTAPLSGAQTPLSGGSSGAAFSEGEALFMKNKPAEAAARLEIAVKNDPANITAALYLGIAYQQTGRFDDSIDTLKKVLSRAGDRTALVAYNIGNAYFAKGAAVFAEQFYTKALESDSGMASAYLNRANARIRTGALREAVDDYGQYLVLEPSSPKRPSIEKVIALISEEFASAERAKMAAEEAAKAEETRRKQLLDEVAASLQAAAENTKGLSSGAEDVIQYDGEFVLE